MNPIEQWAGELAGEAIRKLAARRREPEATYRLQFRAGRTTFRDAESLVPYLSDLGVSHVYASPYLKAHTGSCHGYDIVDYGALNPELGGEEDYAAWIQALRSRGMGHIADFVPNHMGIVAAENVWWSDVLENGASSPYASFFDIDWHPVKAELENKVLLPLLGEQYGEALEAGQLRLQYRDGAFVCEYFDCRLPLDPRTYPTVLARDLERLKDDLGVDSPEMQELESILTALDYLPQRTETSPERIAERQREKEVVKGRLRRLTDESRAVAEHIERNVRALNGTPGDADGFDALDALLNDQAYRLSHWKAAGDEINYRRFFDINELAAVCEEEPRVFDAMHAFLFERLVRDDIDGLRIDHIDGLYDPADYLRRLQRGFLLALGRAEYHRRTVAAPASREPPPAWEELEAEYLRIVERAVSPEGDSPIFVRRCASLTGKLGQSPAGGREPLYVVVEKILGPEEPLPADWPTAGTTGYDFQNTANRLLIDPEGLSEILKCYHRFIGASADFRETAYEAKRTILRVAMASDLQLLAHRLNRLSEHHRRTRDFTLNTLRVALREILSCFPVYRTYIGGGQVPDRDRQIVQRAVAQAKRRNPARNAAAFDFVRDVLLLEQPPGLDDEGRREREMFVGRFQQVTSPLVAKGVEDTAFYVHVPLLSLNEVGNDPAQGAASPADFHRENLDRSARRPGSLLATSTHDAKRSEDVRARIDVLTEIPRLRRAAVNRWARINRRHRREVDGLSAPSRNDEYLLYQTLVGAWPLEIPDARSHEEFVDRIQGFMQKAVHEAKQRSSWINPNPEYDAAVRAFVEAIFRNRPKNRFLADFRAFQERIVPWGLSNALSQTLLKLTSPGVPDLYQGQELWDFSLVDPDNRRPVDFSFRRELLTRLQFELSQGDEAQFALASRLARQPTDPSLKLYVTWQSLRFRREQADLFRRGSYVPLEIEGPSAEHAMAFAWRWKSGEGRPERTAVVVVPRLVARLAARFADENGIAAFPLDSAAWAESRLLLADLPCGRLSNVFTGQIVQADDGGSLPLAAILADFPVALLEGLSP